MLVKKSLGSALRALNKLLNPFGMNENRTDGPDLIIAVDNRESFIAEMKSITSNGERKAKIVICVQYPCCAVVHDKPPASN